MKGAGIDYSKWEHIGEDTSGEEGDNDDGDDWTPKVHKLDGSSRVTFGKGEVAVEPSCTTKAATVHTTTCSRTSDREDTPIVKGSGYVASSPNPNLHYPSTTLLASYSRNGCQYPTHLWSQTKREVYICVFVPIGTRARDVRVRVTLHTVNKQAHLSVLPVAPNKAAYVDADLAYAISDSEEDLESCYSLEDWDATRRIVRIELHKVLFEGVAVHWWARALATDPELPEGALVDRDSRPSTTEASAKWKSAWDEAHAAFRQKVATNKPIELDMEESDEEQEP
ncbi:hypothetical protein Pelo_2527 [Pelomyxa schiedti]|nr:hypothetical protein Pelo_2527 [Pelomyxa schiedti]